MVARPVFLPASCILDRKFAPFPGHLERSDAIQDKFQLLVIAFGKNQQEFVATHADREVAAPNSSIQSSGEFLKH